MNQVPRIQNSVWCVSLSGYLGICVSRYVYARVCVSKYCVCVYTCVSEGQSSVYIRLSGRQKWEWISGRQRGICVSGVHTCVCLSICLSKQSQCGKHQEPNIHRVGSQTPQPASPSHPALPGAHLDLHTQNGPVLCKVVGLESG